MYYFLSLSVYMDVRRSFDWLCLLTRVCMWAFRDPSFFVFIFVICFESEMSDLLLRALSHCPFHHCIRYWRDLLSYLIWADHHSFSYSMLHHHPCFHFWLIIFSSPLIPFLQWPYFRVWYFLRIIIIHLVISLISLHCIITATMFTVGTLGSMAHGIYYTCCTSYMRAWVLIIGYLSLVFLRLYHPITLAYVTSCVLRPPWGHGIRYRLLRLLFGQVFEIWLTFRYCHVFSSGRHLSDV